MKNLCLSSEIYKLDIKDVIKLEDSTYAEQFKNRRKVIILMGDLEHGTQDTLLCGRAVLEKAVKNKKTYIGAQIAFVTKIKKYDLITPFIKKMRGKYKICSSNIYHIDPKEIRRLKIERSFRDKKSAYAFTNPRYRRTERERLQRYEALYDSMKNGFDDNYPIDITLLRMLGIKDTVNNGHHRMGIALECGLPQVSVRFSAAGQAPRLLHPLLRIIANIAIRIKQIKK